MKNIMQYGCVLLLTASVLLGSCKKEKHGPDPGNPTNPPNPAPVVFLKDITITNLPSPYYHFEYDATGKVTATMFASGLGIYNVEYNGDRISEIRNNTMVNKDRLQYRYDAAGHIDTIRYVDEGGIFYRRSYFTYTGQKLTNIKWERQTGAGFTLERDVKLVYGQEGNLSEMTDKKFAVAGQFASTLISTFVQYDNKVNTDAFALIHDTNNDHLLLFPGIELQKNNPGKMIRTGDGLHYDVEYTYTYNEHNIPVSKTGQVVITNGPNAGQRFQSNTGFTYY